MRALDRLRDLPLTVKVPAIVALLMVGVSAVISQQVLARLAETQERQLKVLSDAYLDGLSSALLPAVLRDDIWEAYDAIERANSQFTAMKPVETVVTVASAGGRVLASSDPGAIATLSTVPASFAANFSNGELRIDTGPSLAYVRRDLVHQNRELGAILSSFDVSHLMGERASVLNTLLVTNGVLAVFFAGLGYWAVRRMIQPVRVVAEHLRLGLAGRSEPIPQRAFAGKSGELKQLFEGYNALVEADREREALSDRLYDEERLASLGRLASGMAHEINNPLGGMLNALDALERYGDRAAVRKTSASLLRRGLFGIREVVNSALVTYRLSGDRRTISAGDIDDLRVLISPEVRRKNLTLSWTNDIGDECDVPAHVVRQMALNLLLNACAAVGEGGQVAFAATQARGGVSFTVRDDGPGLPMEVVSCLQAPEDPRAPVGDRAGLGLWMVRRLADESGGTITARNRAGGGAEITVGIPSGSAEQVDVA